MFKQSQKAFCKVLCCRLRQCYLLCYGVNVLNYRQTEAISGSTLDNAIENDGVFPEAPDGNGPKNTRVLTPKGAGVSKRPPSAVQW